MVLDEAFATAVLAQTAELHRYLHLLRDPDALVKLRSVDSEPIGFQPRRARSDEAAVDE
jgi:hypothetical protein